MKLYWVAPLLLAGCYASDFAYDHHAYEHHAEHHAIEEHAAYDHAMYGHPHYAAYGQAPAPVSESYAPRPGFVWVPGAWQWNGGEWIWQAGSYQPVSAPPPAGY